MNSSTSYPRTKTYKYIHHLNQHKTPIYKSSRKNQDLLFGNIKQAQLELLTRQLQHLFRHQVNPESNSQEQKGNQGFLDGHDEGPRRVAFPESQAGPRGAQIDAEAESSAAPGRVDLPSASIGEELLTGRGGRSRRPGIDPNANPDLSTKTERAVGR